MFDAKKSSQGLESSTFDIVDIHAFYNTRFWTIMSYLWVWVLLGLSLAILGGDTYTCVSILVFNRWSTDDYEVYEYKVAKWIFTGCILFRFVLLAYQIAWGIHIFRTRNIALAYLNNYARMMYAIRSYTYQCLFHEIDQEGFFEWACFFVYTELDNALEVLVADLPRQVINFMTLRFYATGGDLNNDILANIRAIANTNLRLSIILSFQLATMVLFLFFFFKFVLAILLFIPIKVKVSNKGYRSLKSYCYHSVNEDVRSMVKKNHKSRTQIFNEGLMSKHEINANPLLASESTFDLSKPPSDVQSIPSFSDGKSYPRPYNFAYRSDSAISLSDLTPSSRQPPMNNPLLSSRTVTAANMRSDPFADEYSSRTNLRDPFVEAADPFSDSKASLISSAKGPSRRPPPRSQTTDSFGYIGREMAPDPFADSARATMDSTTAFKGQKDPLAYPARSQVRTESYSSFHNTYGDSAGPISNLDETTARLLPRGNSTGNVLDEESSIHNEGRDDNSVSSSNSLGHNYDSNVQYLSANSEDAPYPVRGVSQYMSGWSDEGVTGYGDNQPPNSGNRH